MSTLYIGYARLLCQCLTRAGINVTSLFGRAQVEALWRLPGWARMPVAAWHEMVDCAQCELPATDVALEMAAFITPMDMGSVGFMAMACGDLLESAQAFARFFPLLNDAYALSVAMEDGRLTTRMVPLHAQRSHHLERLTLGALCWHSRWLARRMDLCFDVCLPSPSPGERRVRQFAETFGGDLRFDAEVAALRCPEGAGRLTVSRDGAGVRALLGSQLSADMADLETASAGLLMDVERAVVAMLAQGEVRIEEVAAALGMSVRTLQHRLQAQGLAFRAVLDRIRRGQALALIAQGEVALVDVATILGFSSQSSFARAFQRWTRTSPGAYRNRCLRSRAEGGRSACERATSPTMDQGVNRND
ncbi:MAG: AraC family transcriptional regulator ligand-binding domain-containing protein [Aquabacterium sp.]